LFVRSYPDPNVAKLSLLAKLHQKIFFHAHILAGENFGRIFSSTVVCYNSEQKILQTSKIDLVLNTTKGD